MRKWQPRCRGENVGGAGGPIRRTADLPDCRYWILARNDDGAQNFHG
ncbi:hypothetical protein PUN28_010984 [Cardiocondyla obscurior]|uniref:Uncharacterized protein n=1 Tax=Cardiocondyla obscurior TaxID=286306 RepID=A0AAW2FIL9_9HYME